MAKNKIAIVIPSRIGSTRLPGKPLKMIGKFTMIEHVVHRALESDVGSVYVATDSEAIAEKATIAGATPVMVTKEVETGTDRVWEAVQIIAADHYVEHVINLQGDLPLVSPQILITLANKMTNSSEDIVTPVVKEFTDEENNPSRVKVTRAIDDRALYFSRSQIPHGSSWYWHHVGIYGFNMKSLERFVKLPQSYTEMSEKLEQLRALENGMTIGLCEVFENVLSVDTEEDLKKIQDLYIKLH